jgi:prepilin-type processing-associated H-X9-DG protein
MPIEIKELHIKVTVPTEADRDTAGDLLLFADLARDDAGIDDPVPPTLFGETPDAAAGSSHHPGGVNLYMGDGSVRVLPDGLDLFG